jgi:hypothetical protein
MNFMACMRPHDDLQHARSELLKRLFNSLRTLRRHIEKRVRSLHQRASIDLLLRSTHHAFEKQT